MSDTISVTGLIATPPKYIVSASGLSVTTFRFASTQRRFDRAAQKWVDGDTNWYTVATFRQLAINVNASLQKGQRVIVTGKLRVRDWATDEKRGTNVEIDADSVGHDLTWGTTIFTRSTATAVAEADVAADSFAEPTADPQPQDPDAVSGGEADADPASPGLEGQSRLEEPVGSAPPF